MNPGSGVFMAVAGGLLMGSFSLPMKKTDRWSWEATWLVWAVVALVIVPWVVALWTCQDLASVYAGTGKGTLATIFLFGVGWGLGAVTFGQSISILGMSLAFAVSIGLTLALGALIPMTRQPEVFLTAGGATITAGIILMLVGVIVCAVAGNLKESRVKGEAGSVSTGEQAAVSRGAFVKGLTLCILSGVFNPMINFANAYAEPLKQAAERVGASPGGAADAIWAVALLGGFLTNAVYCSILLSRNRTWSCYQLPGTAGHWLLAALMGVTWVCSIILFGRAVSLMGQLGNSAGWAITMGCCIAISNVWGIVSGEWREGRGKPLRTMYVGLAVILTAVAVIGYGNSLRS